jgi:predicted phage baseplate assembly protein
MTDEVWWGREAPPGRKGRTVPGPGPGGVQPELVEATRERVRAEIGARVPGYTPDWTNPDRLDAGVALVRLFGNQAEPVLRRLNRLPEKLLVAELDIAGVRPLPATAATALLQFTVNPPDGASVLVPAGFQASAPPASGQGDPVVFETDRDLYATPATLGAVAVAESGRLAPVAGAASGQGRPFAAFGTRPEPGNALWIGLAGTAQPYPLLSIGVVLAPTGTGPVPVGAGGATPPEVPAPLLRWDVLDGEEYVRVAPARDGTGGLVRSGVVELRLPRGWRPGRPPGPRPLPTLRWLRVTIAHGAFATAPVLAALRLNLVEATAVRTIRDEALQAVQGGPVDGRTRMRLSQVPIVPGSIVLDVDEGAEGDVFGTVDAPAARWREVSSLADHSAEDRVFVVDHASGVLTFGDGVHGAKVPLGFRNVVAQRYRIGGGSAGAVRADTIRSLVTSLRFVSGVTNPFPAEGGADAEPPADTMRRGPAQLSARGRAVTPDDYALLALRTPGALVARAHGVAGLDPARPGVPVPGVVGVLVVPAGPDSDQPPAPSAGALRAVANFLVAEAAPAGVRVVAAAPEFQRVAIEAWVVLDPEQERADLLTRASDALADFLHPVRGGPDGGGWPFGAPLRYTALVRRLLAVPGIRAVPQLRSTVDGQRVPPCSDQPLRPGALLWPARPVLIPVEEPS